MTNTTQPMTSREAPKMLGGISTDELEKMAKTHPRSALTMAYGQGLVTGINRAKANQQAVISEKDKQIAELRQQLAERDAVIAKKDEALKQYVDVVTSNYDPNSFSPKVNDSGHHARDALLVTTESNVLDEYVMSRLEPVKIIDRSGNAIRDPNNRPFFILKP